MQTPTMKRSLLLRGGLVGCLALLSVAARGIPDDTSGPPNLGSENGGPGSVLALQLQQVSVSAFSAEISGSVSGRVKLDAVAPLMTASRGVYVALRSTSGAVASVSPATVQVLPQRDNAAFSVNALSPGCTMIVASYAGRSRSVDFVVHPARTAATFSLAVPNQSLYHLAPSTGTVTFTSGFSGTVSLSSSNPSVASVPSSVSLKTGQTAASFPITTTGMGCAIITASVQGRTTTRSSRTVLVLPLPG